MFGAQLRKGFRRGAPAAELHWYSINLGILGRACVISASLGLMAVTSAPSHAAPFSVVSAAAISPASPRAALGLDAPLVFVESVPEPEPGPAQRERRRDSRTDNEDTWGRAGWCSRPKARGAGPSVIEEVGSVLAGLLTLEIPPTARHGAKSKRYARCR